MLYFIMRRSSLIYLLLSSTALLYPACSVSVGDGDGDFTGDGDGDAGGQGGDTSSSGPGGSESGSGGSVSGSGGSVSGSGGKNQFTPSAFVPPSGMPADLPEVVRMGGYDADSAELRIRDAFRAGYGTLNDQLTEECGWGMSGDDYFVDLEMYGGLCSLACMTQHLSCTDDAQAYVCDYLDSSNASTDLASCLAQCEEFFCDDNSSDTAYRCDFELDCDDGSDEADCGDLAFMCADGSASISGFGVCDGTDDCDDASDEEVCGYNGYVCSDGTRIQAAFQCDGSSDCADGGDEENCSDLVYDCGGGELIPWYKRCDGIEHCSDASDEQLGCILLDESMCPG